MKKVQLILILSIISQAAFAQITFVETDLDGTNYNALRSIAVSPDGKFVYGGRPPLMPLPSSVETVPQVH